MLLQFQDFFSNFLDLLLYRFDSQFEMSAVVRNMYSSGSPSNQLTRKRKNYTPFSPSRSGLHVEEWAEPLFDRRGIKASGRTKEAGGGVLPVFAQTHVKVSAETLAAYRYLPTAPPPPPSTTSNHTGPKPHPPTHTPHQLQHMLLACLLCERANGRAGGRTTHTIKDETKQKKDVRHI